MKQEAFERDRRAEWEGFERALDGVRLGHRLAADASALDFIASYQRVARDLAVAKSRGYSRRLIARLNQLVMRGHNVVYTYRSSYLRAVLGFLAAGFPQAVRRLKGYVAIAAILFLGPGFATIAAVAVVPDNVYSVLSAGQVSQLEGMYDPAADKLGRERGSDTDFAMFGFYIMNNISIAFQMFAGGLVFGLLTVFYLVYNGVFIGASTGHMITSGFQEPFLSFVVGHGAFELTAIVLAGAAGLMLGNALLAPGAVPRLVALKRAAARAVDVLLGATLMLLVAAFIEAFWSSSSTVAPLVKYVVGGVLWSVVLGYLTFAGRGGARA